MEKIILIFKNWKTYRGWRTTKNGWKPINMKRGTGYYFPTGFIGVNNKGRIEHIKMKSGKTAIAELIDWNMHNDPSDMIKESFWHISGYEGEKLFKDMTFPEFLKSTNQP